MWFTHGRLPLAAILLALAAAQVAQPLRAWPTLPEGAGGSNPHDVIVRAHNEARTAVGVGPISWNASVAAYAQGYADRRAHDCNLEHSMGPYGENLAEGYGRLEGADAVKMWVSERPNYDQTTNSCAGDECLHYTQVVWRDSVRLGCGRANCDNGWVFVICSYDPPGNVEGQRPY